MYMNNRCMNTDRKHAIVMGATSGIGLEVARLLAARGWKVGIAGRREKLLYDIMDETPGVVAARQIDVNSDDAVQDLMTLIDNTGGMDLYFHSSGIGFYNPELDVAKELATVTTNCLGFTRMVTAAFDYFASRPLRHGHIAVISSIARTRGLGAAPAYSSSKRFVSHYLECLQQLAHIRHLDKLTITDIRPGFVRTPLIEGSSFPYQLSAEAVAKDIVAAIERRRATVTINGVYRLLVGLWSLIPRWLWVRMRIVGGRG